MFIYRKPDILRKPTQEPISERKPLLNQLKSPATQNISVTSSKQEAFAFASKKRVSRSVEDISKLVSIDRQGQPIIKMTKSTII